MAALTPPVIFGVRTVMSGVRRPGEVWEVAASEVRRGQTAPYSSRRGFQAGLPFGARGQ